jgi:Domain of unknown function (DUF1844)
VTPEDEKDAAARPAETAEAALPGIDFSTLVLSLATSAMVHMGLVPETGGGPIEKNLALAHQTIDTLAMLQTKTRGNLSEDETKLLQSVLYELRMGYVKARG